MPFNLAKCEHLTVTNCNSPMHSCTHHYKLNDYTIRRLQSIKYLGLTTSHDLSWSPHIFRIVSKVSILFQRNLSYYSRDLKVKCYQTYIHPIIKYATLIWSPLTQSDIYIVEMLQRKAARFVFNDSLRFSSVNNNNVRTFRMGNT